MICANHELFYLLVCLSVCLRGGPSVEPRSLSLLWGGLRSQLERATAGNWQIADDGSTAVAPSFPGPDYARSALVGNTGRAATTCCAVHSHSRRNSAASTASSGSTDHPPWHRLSQTFRRSTLRRSAVQMVSVTRTANVTSSAVSGAVSTRSGPLGVKQGIGQACEQFCAGQRVWTGTLTGPVWVP